MSYLYFTPISGPWDTHGNDIIQRALDKVASSMQTSLKSRLDHGIDPSAAINAQATTVRNAEGRLVVQLQKEGNENEAEPETMDDLFKSSSQPPVEVFGRLAFRQVTEAEATRKVTTAIRHSFEEAMHLRFPDYLQEAEEDVVAENPGVK